MKSVLRLWRLIETALKELYSELVSVLVDLARSWQNTYRGVGMDRFKLTKDLKLDEGFIPHAYKDSLGYTTIGYGRLIDKQLGGGITEDEADYLLANDIVRVENALDKEFPWWRKHPENVQRAMANMCFNLGIRKFKAFKNTLSLIKQGLYNEAADNALKSLWARQVPNRAKRVTDLMRKVTL